MSDQTQTNNDTQEIDKEVLKSKVDPPSLDYIPEGAKVKKPKTRMVSPPKGSKAKMVKIKVLKPLLWDGKVIPENREIHVTEEAAQKYCDARYPATWPYHGYVQAGLPRETRVAKAVRI